jgi:signal transduction histidine kinase
MYKLSIYLAGPITAVSKESASFWRQDFVTQWGEKFEVRNPLDRDKRYEGKVDKERHSLIANDERVDIVNCDATIAYLPEISMGTAMGIMYAYLSGKTVVIVTPIPSSRLSPMLHYHAHYITTTFEDAVTFIEKRHSRSSIESIKKRDGRYVAWDSTRIQTAIQAAINDVYEHKLNEAEIPKPRADKLANAVVMRIEDDLADKKFSVKSLDIEKVQDYVEKIIIDNAHCGEMRALVKEYITYRRLHQETRESAGNDYEINQFIKDILHEIKGPAGNLGRYLQFIDKSIDQKDLEKAQEWLGGATENQREIMRAIASSKEKAQNRFVKTSEKVSEVIQKIYENLKQPKSTFHNHIPESICVYAAPHQLKTIFHNLIENSIKHGFQEGEGNIFARARVDDHHNFILEYWNDGKPITAREAEMIFSIVNKPRANLDNFHHGMSQVRRYVEQLGGSIECHPVTEQSNFKGLPAETYKPGSPMFRIKLPLSDKDCNQKKCILVADDNENDRKMINDIFSDTDFEILEAATIDDALAVIDGTRIVGAVLDVDFRESRSGLWLLKKIMKNRPEIKVIVVSGSPSSKVGDWRSEAEKLGAVAAFDKASYTDNQILSVF